LVKLGPASQEFRYIPVFQADDLLPQSASDHLPKQILGNWTGGEKVRIWFGEPIDLSQFYGKRDALRTHKEIADHLMTKIGELAEKDRAEFQKKAEVTVG